MHIKEVKTARKIGTFKLRTDGHRNKIALDYAPGLTKVDLIDTPARIYLFTENGIIKKIGGSSGKNGIHATMSFYVGAMTGSPGVPRFVIHLLIEEALKRGSKVELYMITSPRSLATVSGLFATRQQEIASFKEMEDYCKADYFAKEGRYPDWNFQENNHPYPAKFAQRHNTYHTKRLATKKKR